MGQKPTVLEGRDIPSIAQYIKSDKCKNVFLMVGAGISTSAGIPDFRSPDTGLYANLAKLKLPYPEAVFDIGYFRQNPLPFYTLAAELYPGHYRPTPTHAFIKLLNERGLLHTCFTQNIDTLERRAGIPVNKIVEAHGSFATQRCIKCRKPSPDSHVQEHVRKASVPYCLDKYCKGIVKPDIVFFGEGLPADFTEKAPYLAQADLLIIMGTSLTVYPFAGLRSLVPDSCPRILINLDRVGDLGSKRNDVVLQMDCDEAVRKLCDELGKDWRDDLERLWKETEDSYTPFKPEDRPIIKPEPKPTQDKAAKKKKTHDGLEKEIAKLAEKIKEKMALNDARTDGKELKPSSSSRDTGAPPMKNGEVPVEESLVDKTPDTKGSDEPPATAPSAKYDNADK